MIEYAFLNSEGLATNPNSAASSWQMQSDRPVVEWFNRTAPRIKSGEVVPEQIDAETALTQMVGDPILIRRPLIQVGDRLLE